MFSSNVNTLYFTFSDQKYRWSSECVSKYFDLDEVKALYGTIGVVAVDVPWGLLLNRSKNGIIYMDQVHEPHIEAICNGIFKVLRPRGMLLCFEVTPGPILMLTY